MQDRKDRFLDEMVARFTPEDIMGLFQKKDRDSYMKLIQSFDDVGKLMQQEVNDLINANTVMETFDKVGFNKLFPTIMNNKIFKDSLERIFAMFRSGNVNIEKLSEAIVASFVCMMEMAYCDAKKKPYPLTNEDDMLRFVAKILASPEEAKCFTDAIMNDVQKYMLSQMITAPKIILEQAVLRFHPHA